MKTLVINFLVSLMVLAMAILGGCQSSAEKVDAAKENVEEAKEELKKAHADKNFADIDSATEKLNAAWTAASEDLYKATQEQQANANAGNPEGGNTTGGDKTADVQDVDFEEVK